MRKIVAGLFISLDGVVESPQKWHFPYFDGELAEVVGAQMAGSDTMLLGRHTYEEFAAYWPNPEARAQDMAPYMNDTPKHVVTTTLDTATWQNTTLVKGDVTAHLTELKRRPGTNISVTGSPTLVRCLLRDGLLDELHLTIHPVVVGSGKRLFDDGTGHLPLTLLASRTLTSGIVYLTYGRA
ncbi:dihydrofolate reductase family protein [Nonomuraea indica]|uniref:Dihydrofolate reductase family protein n=1 Tax=Nonomuraea indica TaxID=1581193 RepID=A0ABW8A8B9_9ACTN